LIRDPDVRNGRGACQSAESKSPSKETLLG
jgi:hypothetical protein